MTPKRTPLSRLTLDHIQGFGRSLTPFQAEFRGKLLCAVDLRGDVVIKGLLQFSGQKDNAGRVIEALNLIHSRALVSTLRLRSGASVIAHFLKQEIELTEDVFEIATTLLCDDIQSSFKTKLDAGQILERFAFLCKTQPRLIFDILEKAQAIVSLDKKNLESASSKQEGEDK